MDIKKIISNIAGKLEANYKSQEIFSICDGCRMPKQCEVIELLDDIRRVIFPGYFGEENTSMLDLGAFAGTALAYISEGMLKQVRTAIIYENRANATHEFEHEAQRRAGEITESFLKKLPCIQSLIYKDIDAQLEGDPAAKSKEDVVFSYPGIYAITVYRIAHVLYGLNVPYIPRIMSEHAHSQTGIDINPGANIGEYFFIDHGTGIVIGETTDIGDRVKIYQGVTLGALSTMKGQALSGIKRHPTICDNVVIYANATILGGDTVIGKNSVIAGNTFVTKSVPENTTASAMMPELRLRHRRQKAD